MTPPLHLPNKNYRAGKRQNPGLQGNSNDANTRRFHEIPTAVMVLPDSTRQPSKFTFKLVAQYTLRLISDLRNQYVIRK